MLNAKRLVVSVILLVGGLALVWLMTSGDSVAECRIEEGGWVTVFSEKKFEIVSENFSGFAPRCVLDGRVVYANPFYRGYGKTMTLNTSWTKEREPRCSVDVKDIFKKTDLVVFNLDGICP